MMEVMEVMEVGGSPGNDRGVVVTASSIRGQRMTQSESLLIKARYLLQHGAHSMGGKLEERRIQLFFFFFALWGEVRDKKAYPHTPHHKRQACHPLLPLVDSLLFDQ